MKLSATSRIFATIRNIASRPSRRLRAIGWFFSVTSLGRRNDLVPRSLTLGIYCSYPGPSHACHRSYAAVYSEAGVPETQRHLPQPSSEYSAYAAAPVALDTPYHQPIWTLYPRSYLTLQGCILTKFHHSFGGEDRGEGWGSQSAKLPCCIGL
ncbi:hypothetical protein OH76DRAFT_524608 [Lentinus brumalis]|uniref:Uncharacterized protein n=1 Tax=Lentinus brumalis TaxID=2498619 RepID=A0A371CHQ2_9APHY|nr:hypothetical protein OH76DRAFT_524608 [Polyporus brumalis]